MTDQHVREIPLSGKQLVFLFMSGIVLLVVVFLLGVSVGRGVGAPALVEAVETGVQPGDTQVLAGSPGEVPPAVPEVPAQLNPGRSAGAATPPADPPSLPPPPAVTPPPPPPPPPAVPTAEREAGWIVQVGAFRTRVNADSRVAVLKDKGLDARIEVEGTLHRVWLGPYAARDEAQRIVTRLQREGIESSIIR